MKKIAIVILHFNGEKDTLRCLDSIEQLSCEAGSRFARQVIVVDNGSDEEFKVPAFAPSTPLRASAGKQNSIKEVKVIRNERNLGFAGGNNVGIKYALENGADYVLILNNDTLVDKGLITELLKVADSDEKIGIVAPKIYFAKGFEFHKDRYRESERGRIIWYAGGIMDWKNIIGHHRGVDEVDKGQFEKVEETDYATGCCMLIKKEVFEMIGFLDKKYFLYYEDSDFSQRSKLVGYKIKFVPKAIVWHKNAGSAGGSGSSMQDYYITRNRLIFGIKYASLRAKLALIKETIKLFFSGRPWQKRGVFDFYLMKFNKGSYR
ncbi:MAG: glycosyltransferase family 2 protein [Candidatus Levyibacteriota bacterium]